MKNTHYLKDSTSAGDEEKILYHFLNEEMAKYLKRKNTFLVFMFLFLATAVAGIILFASGSYYAGDVGIGLLIGGIVLFAVFLILLLTNKVNAEIDRLELVHLPVSQMNFQNGSVLVDRSGVIDATRFDFTNLDPEEISLVNSTFQGLVKQTSEMPPVLSGNKQLDIRNQDAEFDKKNLKIYEEEVNLMELNQTIENAFERTNDYKVDLKAYRYSPELIQTLSILSVMNPDNVVEESREKEVLESLQKMDGIIDMYQGEKEALIDIDDLCMEILQLEKKSVPRMDFSMHSSLNQIAFATTFKYTEVIEDASYNFYCPQCNRDLIQQLETFDYTHDGNADKRVNFPVNTLMEVVDIHTRTWKCPLCECETNEPHARHKFEDELFTPVYDKLYEENYLERLKVYNHINDEKRKYSTKAEELFHEVMRESRTKVDNIKSKIRSIQSELSAEQMAIQSMNNLLAKYKKIAEERSQQIQNDLANHKKAISEENRKSRQRIDNAVDEAKDSIQKSTDKYAKLEREDQSKRDKVQQQIANNTKETAKNTKEIARHTKSIDRSVKDTNRILLGKKPKRGY